MFDLNVECAKKSKISGRMESFLKTNKKATNKEKIGNGSHLPLLCNVHTLVDILQTGTQAKFNLSFCFLFRQKFSPYDSCKKDC